MAIHFCRATSTAEVGSPTLIAAAGNPSFPALVLVSDLHLLLEGPEHDPIRSRFARDGQALHLIAAVVHYDLENQIASLIVHGSAAIGNHLVFGGDQVRAWLRSPRRLLDGAAGCLHTKRDWGIGHERGRVCTHVCGE